MGSVKSSESVCRNSKTSLRLTNNAKDSGGSSKKSFGFHNVVTRSRQLKKPEAELRQVENSTKRVLEKCSFRTRSPARSPRNVFDHTKQKAMEPKRKEKHVAKSINTKREIGKSSVHKSSQASLSNIYDHTKAKEPETKLKQVAKSSTTIREIGTSSFHTSTSSQGRLRNIYDHAKQKGKDLETKLEQVAKSSTTTREIGKISSSHGEKKGKELETKKRNSPMLERPSLMGAKRTWEIGKASKRIKEIGKSNSERLSYCGICMEKKAKAEMFRIRSNRASCCAHCYCHVCISNHVAAKIRQNIIKVKCPHLVCDSYLEPQDCRSVVPQQVLDRWEAALCESLLGSKKIYCPFKDCSALLVDDNDGDEDVTSAECPHCHRLFCAQCQVPWHAGSDCKSNKAHESMDMKFMDLAKREKWQKCPNCSFYVQRTSGCECITCRCGHRFCYICGGLWNFGHLCRTAGKKVTFLI